VDDFSHIKRCIELTEQDVARAVESREDTRVLLAHLATIAAPGTGVAKSLLVFARMATTACEWLDGDLRIEIVGDAEVSAIEVLEELGMGMRERVFPPLAFMTPLEEFARAVERVPHMIAPLAVQSKTARRMVLGATAEVRRSSLPPPPIKISEDSFVVVPKAPAVAKELEGDQAPPSGLPVVGSQQVAKRKKSSRPPPRRNDPSSARIAVAGKKITVTREAPPAELPLVTAAKPVLQKPPLPRPGAGKGVAAAPKPAVPAAPRPAVVQGKGEEPKRKEGEEDIDSGWDDS
jgi:hypothetical protein